jgi:hypothetical protein
MADVLYFPYLVCSFFLLNFLKINLCVLGVKLETERMQRS